MDNTRFKYILIFIIIVSFSCENNEPNYYIIPNELKEYGFFKPGTYWVYNSHENIIDSIWVVGTEKKEFEKVDGKKVIGRYESNLVKCESNTNFEYTYNLERISESWSTLDFSAIDTSINERYGIGLFYNVDKFDELSYSDDIISIHDSLLINAKFYYDIVYKQSISSNGEFGKNDTLEYWLARNIGIVKKIVSTELGKSECTLIRCNIVQ